MDTVLMVFGALLTGLAIFAKKNTAKNARIWLIVHAVKKQYVLIVLILKNTNANIVLRR